MRIRYHQPKAPYKWQAYWLSRLRSFNNLVQSRQHGKTTICAELGFSIIHSPFIKNPIWNIHSDTSDRVFKNFSHILNDHFAGNEHFRWTKPDQTSHVIPRKEGDNITINIYGTRDLSDKGKGQPPHYQLVDEVGKTRSGYVEEVLIPSVFNSGGIVVATGTVEANHWQDLYEKGLKKIAEGDVHWSSFYGRWGDEWSRASFSEEQLQRIKSGYNLQNPTELRIWQKEFLCMWEAAAWGAPFAREYGRVLSEGRRGDYGFDPAFKVGTCWDNGAITAVWFWQLRAGRVVFIKYQEWHEKSTEEVCFDIMKWFRENNAVLDKHIFPHTMNHRIQEAGMKRRAEVALDFMGIKGLERGRKSIIVPRVEKIQTKLDASKALLNRCYFDDEGTSAGLRCLQQYRRKVEKKTGALTDTMEKRYSHGADAFGELALVIQGGSLGVLNSPNLRRESSQGWDAILDGAPRLRKALELDERRRRNPLMYLVEKGMSEKNPNFLKGY